VNAALPPTQVADQWADALLAATLLAIDPVGLGGVRLRAAPDARRELWLQALRAALPIGTPLQRMPLHIGDERMLGGLDLGATVLAGRAIGQPGLLARCDGGVVVVAMAERLSRATAAKLAAVLDMHQIKLQREGLCMTVPARIGVVALDEGASDDEALLPALSDRLAIHLGLDTLVAPWADLASPLPAADAVLAARARLAGVSSSDTMAQVLCETADVLGVASLRAPILALRVARAAAAWSGRDALTSDDLALAARLVLAPRATRVPAPPPSAEPQPQTSRDHAPAPEVAGRSEPRGDEEPHLTDPEDQPLQDLVLQAALAAIPPGLLALLASAGGMASMASGRAGALQASRLRGRPYGSHRGEPRGGARLHLVDTLRAAAPWQALRRRSLDAEGAPSTPRVLVSRDDFHVMRFRQRRETTTVFVVDASGSAALHRLAEAKGAVELLLAECYIRRDKVALIAFRGTPGGAGAELLLPPTRSLVRAKRCLSALPGGGGTPLAAGLDAARALAEEVARRGGTPLVVLLTDGRANMARDGSVGRARAGADALDAARLWRRSGIGALWLDTSPQPQAQAREIALAMGARYLPLPHGDARQVSQAVRLASG
jgi:magnesium chelatase subunit D